MRPHRGLLPALLLAITCASVTASELRDYHAAMADAWRFYRSATFYLRTGNAMVAGFELEQMNERWDSVQERYANTPPDAYADDPAFAHILADGHTRIAATLKATASGDAKTAAAELAPLRAELGALRQRAGVRTFSDCVDDTNAAMEPLYVYRRNLPPLTEAGVVNDLKAKAAVYRYLLQRCDEEATESVRNDPEFRRLVDVSVASVKTLFEALDRGDRTAVINILRELRSSDRMLFLNFA